MVLEVLRRERRHRVRLNVRFFSNQQTRLGLHAKFDFADHAGCLPPIPADIQFDRFEEIDRISNSNGLYRSCRKDRRSFRRPFFPRATSIICVQPPHVP